jgi:acetoin utilization protein AcuB
MLVKERMSKPVITVSPNMPVNEALNLMKGEHIRRLPVIQNGKLVGIVSDKDLLNASPSIATTLSVWEMNYLLSKITVKDVMAKNVIFVEETTPIEAAARIMADNKIGGMPVLRDDKVVGIITETDLFKIFLELMGARKVGVRVTLLVQEQPGKLAKITQAITQNGGNFIAFGVFSGEDPTTRTVTFKLEGLDENQTKILMEELGEKILDIRVC